MNFLPLNLTAVLSPRLLIAAVLLLGAAAPASAVDLSGHWEGNWKSCVTGHKGPMKAEFCRIDAMRYKVTFTGRFFAVLPFRYSVVLQVVEETEDSVTLSGSSQLGKLAGGTFWYTATADGCTFHADYRSCKDNGYFHLTRACCK